VTDCAFSPDGARVVSASADLSLKLWDAVNGVEIANLLGHGGVVTACAFAPAGDAVVSGSADGTIKIWDAVTADLAGAISPALPERHAGRVNAIGWSAKGTRVVTASADTTLAVWDAASARRLASLAGHRAAVNACAFGPGDGWLLSASDDHHVTAWDPNTGQRIANVGLHGHKVVACAVSPDGSRAISSSLDRSLRLWALDGDGDTPGIEGRGDGLQPWAFSPNWRWVLSGDNDGTLRISEVATGTLVGSISAHRTPVLACAWSPMVDVVASVALGTIRVWQLPNTKPVLTLGPGDEDQGSLELLVMSVGAMRAIAEGRRVAACAFSPDGRRIVAAWGNATPIVLDLARGLARPLVGHAGRVTTCRFSSDGARVMTAGEDGTLWFWDVDTGAPLAAYEPELRVTSADLAPDGLTCAVGTAGGELHLLRLEGVAPGPSIATLLTDRLTLAQRLRLRRRMAYFTCPSCAAWFESSRTAAGREAVCPSCRARLRFNPFTVERHRPRRADHGDGRPGGHSREGAP
jgi:WD40 repeat protein